MDKIELWDVMSGAPLNKNCKTCEHSFFSHNKGVCFAMAEHLGSGFCSDRDYVYYKWDRIRRE